MALDNGWVRIETTSGSGNMAVSAMVLERNTGRIGRSVGLVGENAHGVTATALVKQDPATPFIVIDHYENDKYGVVTSFHSGTGNYYIVGYSNVDWMTVRETSEYDYTDLNADSGLVWQNGFWVIEQSGNGDSHTVELETNIPYGTDEQYEFKIPFALERNESSEDRDVYIVIQCIHDPDVIAEATTMITQNGLTE
jgi:hypothetical protein